jgi:hypothetical protein
MLCFAMSGFIDLRQRRPVASRTEIKGRPFVGATVPAAGPQASRTARIFERGSQATSVGLGNQTGRRPSG